MLGDCFTFVLFLRDKKTLGKVVIGVSVVVVQLAGSGVVVVVTGAGGR